MMDSEILIDLVREHLALYDYSHPKYIDSCYKDKIWKQIGQKLNQSVASCKSRWANIRDNYRKSLRKTITKTGGRGVSYVKKYKFSDKLEFLEPFFQKIDTISNGSLDESQSIPDPFQDIENVVKEENVLENFEVDDTQEEEYSDDEPPPKKKTPTSLPSSRGSLEGCMKLFDQVLEVHSMNKQATPSRTDAIDAFLASIAPTLKGLTPYYQNVAKTKIFAIVQEYELKMLTEHHQSTGSSSSLNASSVS